MVSSSKSDDKARCRLCKKDKLYSMGIQALFIHFNGKKHERNDVEVKSFFIQNEPKLILARQLKLLLHVTFRNHLNHFLYIANLVPHRYKPALNLLLQTEKTKAEILWALKLITAGYWNKRFSDNVTTMFPDSKIINSFQMGLTKLKYTTNFRIAHYFKSLLL